jgi:hypothetical protein
MNYFHGKHGHEIPFGFHVITFEERGAHDNVMFYPSHLSRKFIFDQSNSLGKCVECMCDQLDGNKALHHL